MLYEINTFVFHITKRTFFQPKLALYQQHPLQIFAYFEDQIPLGNQQSLSKAYG